MVVVCFLDTKDSEMLARLGGDVKGYHIIDEYRDESESDYANGEEQLSVIVHHGKNWQIAVSSSVHMLLSGPMRSSVSCVRFGIHFERAGVRAMSSMLSY